MPSIRPLISISWRMRSIKSLILSYKAWLGVHLRKQQHALDISSMAIIFILSHLAWRRPP
ncbi:hypothetical protein DsansV1_C37g0232731 [Dioscorea sansibarensis]